MPTKTLPIITTEEVLSMEKKRCKNDGVLPKKSKQESNNGEERLPVNKKRKPSKKLLCARPFHLIKGHSVSLTFATAGNAPRPDFNN